MTGNTNRYKDYDKDKMESLEREIQEILNREGETWNYDMKDKIDWDDIGWEKSTGERALVAIRRTVNSDRSESEENLQILDPSKIQVKDTGEGPTGKKKWVKK